MRHLDRLRLLESPDHPAINRPWDYDVRMLQYSWELGNEGLRLELWLTHGNGDSVDLTFTGVIDLKLEGYWSLDNLRILDATEFRPEVHAPVCVVPYNWKRDGGEPHLWAQSVECRRR